MQYNGFEEFTNLYNNSNCNCTEKFGDKSDKFIGHINTKEHFSHPEKRNEQECLNMNNQFPNSKFVWKDGKCDKIEGYMNNGHSDKGTSDKSTGTGLSDIRNANFLRVIYLLHILLVAPLFMIVGCRGYKNKTLLKVIAYTILLYHGYSLIKSEITGNWNWNLSKVFNFNLKKDDKNATRLRIVYLIHLLVVAPLLLYIAFNNNEYNYWNPNINKGSLIALCSLGIWALIYHGYSYWRSETTGQWNWSWNWLQKNTE